VIVSSGNTVYLIFASDSAVVDQGFVLTYATAPCPANCTVMTESGPTCSSFSCQCLLDDNGDLSCRPFAKSEIIARAGLAAHYDLARDQIIAFGGRNYDTFMNDLHFFSFGAETWLSPRGNSTTPLGVARFASCMTEFGLYIHGGQTDTGATSQFFVYNMGLTWASLTPRGDSPPALYGHTLTYVPSQMAMYLFGGYADSSGMSNRLYVFSIATGTWTKVESSGGDPPATFGHIAVFHADTNNLYFHGGIRDSGRGTYASGDVFGFSLGTNRWITGLKASNYLRMHHAAALIGHYIIFQGGSSPHTFYDSMQCYYGDMFAYDIRNAFFLSFCSSSSSSTLLTFAL